MSEDVKFGKIFKKTLKEAIRGRERGMMPLGGAGNELRNMRGDQGKPPTAMAEPPINLSTPGQESPLGNDLEQTSQLTNPMFNARKGVNRRINQWIATCEKMSKEINDTGPKSWVGELKRAYPEDARAIAAQLSKTAGQLLTAVNDLRTIVNQPEEQSINTSTI